jgi:uncharacterized membrane protein YgaE (UPF0421/DUF939 family)
MRDKPTKAQRPSQKNHATKKAFWLAVKIAIGSSIAIYLAELLHLNYAASAGGIALLTIMGTKWETIRLSLLRIVTFFFSVCLMWLSLNLFHNEVAAYGVFVLFLVLACELLGWKSVISVNAVIATHFMIELDFTLETVWNEFMLVLIGITIAIIVNQFNDNYNCQKEQVQNMRRTEQELQALLVGMADYLSGNEIKGSVWARFADLEMDLREYIHQANEYQDNTFQSHPGYYIDYFEMRLKQCIVLHNLHYEMRRIRNLPKQAKIVADYILYLADYVVEINIPAKQIARLEEIFADMKRQPLPVSREEFENRAILYHILMDLEDFLNHKKKFVENMNETQKKLYWNQPDEQM